MMRNRFDTQLEQLKKELIAMGAEIELAIDNTIKALLAQDVKMAQTIIEHGGKINNMERSIESLCLNLILQQQPVAKDLRLISSALKMITDMERIGDQAEEIAELIIELAKEPYLKPLETIPEMAAVAGEMVQKAIDAYVNKDLSLAKKVIATDDLVDDLFIVVKDDLITLIGEDSKNGTQALDLLMVAKYLERVGDHAVNIGEWVVFSITGMHKGKVNEK